MRSDAKSTPKVLLNRLYERAEPVAPSPEDRAALRIHQAEAEIESLAIKDGWPTLKSEALYGITGKIVRLAEPGTEADPAAILFQFIVGMGNVVGRKRHFTSRPHPTLSGVFRGDCRAYVCRAERERVSTSFDGC